jgi:ureidoacrylate peracid hydrolase
VVDFAITPTRTALINVDMQNWFVEGHPNTPHRLALLERINRLTAACRAAEILVIHASHILRPDGSNIGVLGEVVPKVRIGGFLNRGTVSAALHPGLVVEPGDILLEKPRFGAFHGTDLELILRSRGIDTVIIGGIATNVCCDTTAREANARDFRVLFLSDGTATSSEEAQEATLKTIGGVFGQVLTVEDVVQKIRGGAAVAVPA